jgi:hypothetical protein
MRKQSSRLPSWTGNDAALKVWTIAELDKRDADFDRQMTEEAKNLAHVLAMRTPGPEAANYLRTVGLPTAPRSKAESRKRALTIGKRAAAKHYELVERRAIEDGDIEALRALHTKRPKPDPNGDPPLFPFTPEDRLDEALHDLRPHRIPALWKEKFGRKNRPRGTLTAEEIAAERWGLHRDDVRKRRVHAATRKRLAR